MARGFPQSVRGYLTGGHLAAHWDGFTDAGFGVFVYQLLVQAPDLLIPSLMTADTQATIAVSRMNATNCVWVYAVDHVGNISLMTGAAVLVLEPGSDWDGDGFANRDEELAVRCCDARRFSRLQTPAGPAAVWHRWLGLRDALHCCTARPDARARLAAGARLGRRGRRRHSDGLHARGNWRERLLPPGR